MKSRPPVCPRTAVVYARVSSEEQEKQGYSIPAQQKLLQDYAAQQGIKVVSEFLDVETAKMPGRSGFDEMVDFFRKGLKQRDPAERCRTLLVEKSDRLYRTYWLPQRGAERQQEGYRTGSRNCTARSQAL
jgi:site-specific DNA recombinase